jgi:hypothetical protein
MDKVVHQFASHAEADEFDRQFYASPTPHERIEILLQLLKDTVATEPRLQRGCRADQLKEQGTCTSQSER